MKNFFLNFFFNIFLFKKIKFFIFRDEEEKSDNLKTIKKNLQEVKNTINFRVNYSF